MTSDDTECGRSPDGSGSRPSDGAQEVSTVPASIPNALDELLSECIDDYRNALLNRLDAMWLDRQSVLNTSELNALNGASGELAIQWGLKGWRRRAAESGDAQPQSVSGLSHTGVDRG